MKININRDILAGYVIVLLLVAGWFLMFSQQSSGEYDRMRGQIDHTLQLETRLRNMQISEFGTLMTAHIDFLTNKNVQSLQELSRAAKAFVFGYARIQPSLSEVNSQRAESVQQHIMAYYNPVKEFEGITSNAVLQTRLNATPGFFEKQNNHLNRLRIDLESVKSALAQDVSAQVNEMPTLLSGRFTFHYLIFAAIIILSAVFGILFSRKISARINEVSEKLNEASILILDNAQAEEAMYESQAESIDRTAQTLEELSAFSHEMASGSQNVSKQMETTSQRMSDLKEKAMEIGKITTTIDEITHQINILSLNASIEASRAGEQGKGFSAVALEIRKLAENTRGFTENITRLIKDIQDYTVHTVEMTGDAYTLVRSIADSVNKQNVATAEINAAVSQINTGMKSTVDNIKATVESSENVHALAQQLKAMT